ncbi:MAG TPA: adenylate/guanylate cyclase domain-containing protein [Anaerolineales bacterium]|nr:adenylate/guanylate cyclase domain-containing protein [Anaerolineales bacterium]
MHESTVLFTIPLDQQIQQLTLVVDHLLEKLDAEDANIPPEAVKHARDLRAKLDQISERVKKNEDEREDLLALADISQIVNSSLDLNTVLEIVMDTIIRITGAERCFLMLRDQAGELQMRMARNWEREAIHPSEFEVSMTVINKVASSNIPVLSTNAQEDPRFGGQQSIVSYSLRSILCVPMTVKGEVTGVIYADNRIRTGLFTEAERNLLMAFGNQAAIAIENASLFESVRRTLAEVTELKNLMDNVFASIASGVITADVDNKIMLFNEAAEAILGESKSALIGNDFDQSLAHFAVPIEALIQSVRARGEHIVGQELILKLPNDGQKDLILNISPLKGAQDGTPGVAIVVDDLTEKKRLEGQRKMFERMVSPAVIAQLNPEKMQLGGRLVSLTTLFCDIRGFTNFSEGLDPEVLVAVLNRYLSVAADAILEFEGTIDKFMGDAVMAWFNAPIPQADHAARAVKAALRIREGVLALHSRFPSEHHLSVGVGINYGIAVLGLVGTESRLEYTAIGDSVNTAKRIQENSAPNQILICDSTYDQVRDFVEVRSVEPLHAKGKREPLAIYEVVGLKS